jgi:hypothetical protein
VLNVTQFMRFVTMDNVNWHDPEKAEKLHVGNAVQDFMQRTRQGPDQLQPVKKEMVRRVVGSAALKMHDHSLSLLPRPLADEGTPIIINNACVSWHRLAKNLVFGNARAYIGTLFPVTSSEAQEVVIRLLDKHFGKPLAAALWSAQREVYGSSPRRPYVAIGVYPQRLRISPHDVIGRVAARLSSTLAAWKNSLSNIDTNDAPRVKLVRGKIAYYERELAHFRALSVR